jgi:phosphate acetyltransferase
MRTLLVAPANRNAGLTSVCTGLVYALDRQGIRVAFCKPIAQPADSGPDRSAAFIGTVSALRPPEPIDRHVAEDFLQQDRDQELLEMVTAKCLAAAEGFDVLVVEGMVPTEETVYATRINTLVAKALDAEVVLVATPHGLDPHRFADVVAIAANAYRTDRAPNVIVNRANLVRAASVLGERALTVELEPLKKAFPSELKRAGLACVGVVPFDHEAALVRSSDVSKAVGGRQLWAGDTSRRVHALAVCTGDAGTTLPDLRPGTLAITSTDRSDVVLAAAVAAANGIALAGVVLVGDRDPEAHVLGMARRCAPELPVWSVRGRVMDAISAIDRCNPEVPVDDRERIQEVATSVAEHLDAAWLSSLRTSDREPRLSPPAFRYRLIEAARRANQRIVLPEGTEPRTLKAVQICHERKIARCVLLGKPEEIRAAALAAGVTLPDDVEIVDHLAKLDSFVPTLLEWRAGKGLTEARAREELADTIVPGTMMLKLGQVDGLVSGAVHTTAHTIRPALQLIKTAPGSSLVSSCFFMCLPEQVMVFADCAVNPNPTAEQLADIAIQSADSAIAFGIPARVAMLSYSTGVSGAGADVDLVAKATEMAKAKRPDLLIDGPLQYDAATQLDVAKSKAPKSPVAGRATVLIFPDLNTGNVTYKAVQRSAGVVSMGPMLQGMAKPVNDLSRGALVEDIVFTIALTAIQAAQQLKAASAK